jgi:hypothetical protein
MVNGFCAAGKGATKAIKENSEIVHFICLFILFVSEKIIDNGTRQWERHWAARNGTTKVMT